MACTEHLGHSHRHGEACGHARVRVGAFEAFLHDGHLHAVHGSHVDEAAIDVSAENPDHCQALACARDHTAAPQVPHGDHVDVIVSGRLHHDHAGHCDDHGPVALLAA